MYEASRDAAANPRAWAHMWKALAVLLMEAWT